MLLILNQTDYGDLKRHIQLAKYFLDLLYHIWYNKNEYYLKNNRILETQMKIKILSDLHLEFSPFTPTYDGEDLLILAGDISGKKCDDVKNFIKEYLKLSTSAKVIFILGNHEYYGATLSYVDDCYRGLDIERCYFLQNDSVVIDGIRFFGSTMWTNIMSADPSCIRECETIRDYSLISNLTPELVHTAHRDGVVALENILYSSIEPVVVITHHLPTHESVSFLFENSSINDAFASTDLGHIFNYTHPKIPLWIHGHTHTSVDYINNKTRVVCNPRGYSTQFRGFINTENKKFNPTFMIEYKEEYELLDSCSYSFNDLAVVAHGEGATLDLADLSQAEINKQVKRLCQRAGWSWHDRVGDKGIIYTAFAPKIG